MKPVVLVLALLLAFAAAAQPPPVTGPTIGPGPPPRGDLWQMLTPEQREQLWRTLTPAQRADLWRGLQPEERREMRERLVPAEVRGTGPWARRGTDGGEVPPGKTMTQEERQQMREQIREAHRLRRERMEAERATRQ